MPEYRRTLIKPFRADAFRSWAFAWDIRPSARFLADVSCARPQSCTAKLLKIRHDGKSIFRELDSPFKAGRYHSLIVERESLPACLEISAETSDGVIMGLRHREQKIEGVQFHPESILTPAGKQLLSNFLKL